MPMTRRTPAVLVLALTLLAARPAHPQDPGSLDAVQRRLALERLAVAGSAMYVAAHPDDENTAMLAWLAQGRKVRTAYLALTRGDGGQNLIGSEQGAELGVIRTEELLAARRIDGAEQLFTRAIDFGYSKTAEETLAIWGHDEILADVVWAIRVFRPDVVITRFPSSGDGGHGHHTASALLAAEAFTAAADARRFPDQLAFVRPWQATRLLWNAWRRPGEARPGDAPPALTVDLGAYEPRLGRSYAELAAAARSMHKSQGFGAAPRRGALPNDLQHVAGAPFTTDLFDGVDLTWRRFAGGEAVAAALARAAAVWRDDDPTAALPALLDARDAMGSLPPDPLVSTRLAELLELIRACSGLWVEATTGQAAISPGATVKLTATAINRGGIPVRLRQIDAPLDGVMSVDTDLPANQAVSRELTVTLPRDVPVSHPYWLAAPPAGGRYEVADRRLVGTPRNPPPLRVGFVLALAGREVTMTAPVLYRWTDPVEGERVRDLVVEPRVTVNLEPGVLVFPDAAPRTLRAVVRGHAGELAGSVRLHAPQGWRIEPAEAPVSFSKADEETRLAFTVTPPAGGGTATLAATVRTDRDEPARAMVGIAYPHIPAQALFPLAVAKLVRVDARLPVRRIGYVMGSGDEVPAVLRQLGAEVTLLDDDALETADLARYESLVVGVRAFNTRPRLAFVQDRLVDWVRAGGTLVVQYQVSRGLVTDRLGPRPLKLGRGRVTNEGAEVVLLAPTDPVFSTPNRIAAADFAGWVQERGLYFGESWDERVTPLLAIADPGEKPESGALLVAREGRGRFVYTGLAFFRQLPAGVPGGIRLFANLLARENGRD